MVNMRFGLFILLQTGGITLCDLQIGTMFDDQKMIGDVIVVYDKMGPKMCGKSCLYQDQCFAVNYNSDTLICELIKSGGTLESSPGFMYSEINTWTMTYDVCHPNPCTDLKSCIKTASEGYFCRTIKTPCDQSQCKNGSTCCNGLTTYSCRCPSGYNGTFCQITPCEDVVCQYNGTCLHGPSFFTCRCQEGFSGGFCEITPCDGVECQHNGTCEIQGSSFFCQCPDGYSGALCEVTPCDGVECQHNGTCEIQGSSFFCQCPDGYSGALCEDQDCTHYDSLGLPSGIYTIYTKTIPGGIDVFCDMNTAVGGWTVIQRRIDGTENFYRNWSDYKNGFGNVSGEYWLGNDMIHLLTKNNEYKVRFDLEDVGGDKRFAEYNTFIVNSEADRYRLTVSGYRGNAGNTRGFSFNNGAQFSTMDNITSGSCPSARQSGWWHNGCTHVNPNGLWTPGVSQLTSMFWMSWQLTTGMKKISIKIQKQ